MHTAPVVRTPRLLLRAWREEDRAPFAALNADPVVMEHFTGTMTRAESDDLVDLALLRWSQLGYGWWAAERVDTRQFIGFVGLGLATFDAEFTPAVEVGWRLAHEHWGHGFATEGGRASLDHAFDTLGMDEVVSFTAVTNERSWRVMERLGMVRTGRFDHPGVPDGHPVRPHLLYRITARDWSLRQSGG